MKTTSLRISGTTSKIAMSAALALSVLSAPAIAQDEEVAEAPIVDVEIARDPAPEVVTEAAPVTGIPSWGIEGEHTLDSSMLYGVLDNGMRYALKRNTTLVDEGAIRFLVNVGAREEEDDEEGAAHFLEHMAFNGSTNIPEGELIPKLERLGLEFGADTNAETSLEYTMYKLDLPNLDQITVDTSMMILREIAGELTIAEDAVEREKGVILSEYQVRNSPPRRRTAVFLRDALDSPRVGDRVTAEPETIEAITSEKLRNFYEGFYRPERSTLVVVGDFELEALEAQIKDTFGDWEAVGEARERYSPPVGSGDMMRIGTFVDPATPELVDLEKVVPFKPAENTAAEYRDAILEQIAAVALTNRLNALAKIENPMTLGGQAFAQDMFLSAKAYGVLLVAPDGGWADSLKVAEQEWRRALQFGFTQAEIDEANSNLESNLVTMAGQASSAGSGWVADDIARSSLSDSVYLAPGQQLSLYRQFSEEITREAVAKVFREGWGEAPSYIMLASKTAVPDAKQKVAEVFAKSAKVAVTAPVETVDAPFAYTNFGTPGEIIYDRWIDDLGIRAIKFANGVDLNLKPTEFAPGEIAFRMEVGRGSSTMPAGYPGLDFLASVLAGNDGLAAHPVDELRRILAGKQVRLGVVINDDALVAGGETTPEDLLLQLQLLAAQVTDPAFSEETQRQWAGLAPILAGNIENSPQEMFGTAFQSILTDGDDRMGFTDPNVLVERSVGDLAATIGPQFKGGHIELGLVGLFNEAEIIEAVAQTLGALDRSATASKEVRPMRFSDDRSLRTLYHTGEADQGMISLSWPTDDNESLKSSLTRQLLAEMIELKALEILREELGASYTPTAFSWASPTFDGYGHVTFFAPATPSSMDQVSKVIRELVADFTENEPDEDTILRARQPILSGYERQIGTNAGWTAIVVDTQSNPPLLDRRRNRDPVLRSVTAKDIKRAARKYLRETPIEIRVLPKAKEEEVQAGG